MEREVPAAGTGQVDLNKTLVVILFNKRGRATHLAGIGQRTHREGAANALLAIIKFAQREVGPVSSTAAAIDPTISGDAQEASVLREQGCSLFGNRVERK
jgi:hypothetical protein